MKRRRLALVALLAVAVAPGTWLRTHVSEDLVNQLYAQPVSDLPDAAATGGFTRVAVWQLTSPDVEFGGYSALLWLEGPQRFRAVSDRGLLMTFDRPGADAATPVRFSHIWNRGYLSATPPDAEAATIDPATGNIWLAFEYSDAILRYSYRSELEAVRQPPEWQHWPDNSGAEALARLPDGRFLVLPESDRTGLLYPGDPAEEVEPVAFTFELPGRYSPTDAEALPDGRVLVLLRHVTLGYPPFTAAIGVIDPDDITAGATVAVEVLANLDLILPRENYEALAIGPPVPESGAAEGRIALWLMSDDNRASFQRTLLVQLEFDPSVIDAAHEKARED